MRINAYTSTAFVASSIRRRTGLVVNFGGHISTEAGKATAYYSLPGRRRSGDLVKGQIRSIVKHASVCKNLISAPANKSSLILLCFRSSPGDWLWHSQEKANTLFIYGV
jgi:hypothetical protein